MKRPLIYLDHSVVNLVLKRAMKLRSNDEFTLVYSKENFAEIQRSDEPTKYLETLADMGAQMLDLELNDKFNITGNATLIVNESPFSLYNRYVEANQEVEVDERIFDSMIVWLNGGGTAENLRNLPYDIDEQIESLTSGLPRHTELPATTMEADTSSLETTIEQMISYGNDYDKTRTEFGNRNCSMNNLKGPQVISQIWNIVSPRFGDAVTCDQFFGFDPVDKQGNEKWPIYLGIIGGCAVMDILGFHTDKKARNLDKISNIRSDAGHIAMGAFCQGIISEDRRLIDRAKAIYEYKKISTHPMRVERIPS